MLHVHLPFPYCEFVIYQIYGQIMFSFINLKIWVNQAIIKHTDKSFVFVSMWISYDNSVFSELWAFIIYVISIIYAQLAIKIELL